ncbi:MAG: tripartite tricarboxylate transporter substrate binding protein [Rhodoplanes sp.]|uniref:Bug family tripartite tricarboxylate transporter substrate binding protein n=1 Tax=Rhodoplanes sp. TaxID=1968906 RepID=UPI0017ADBBCE|nr:tripartite tricarboxylate transporter substrate-binding protein [Rhodoplanes sp.]NVO16584.1 tripartite tricarboxylate transporter substrate binding protein [Rhodoplanes sp.]
MIDRRSFVLGAAGASLVGPVMAATDAPYPGRPVTVVVPYPPGGSVDLVARAIGEPMGRAFGQPVVVENRGGSGGSVAAQSVAIADPDGYRLVLGTQQTHGTNESLYPTLGYRAVESFAPICEVCTVPHALVVKKTLPVSSATELVALLKREPGKLNYGSTGNGSSSHLACELFKLKAGVEAQHVPYRGGGPLAQDLMAGVVDFGFIAVANIRGPLEGGMVRALAIASSKRVALMPDIPTLAEAGVPDVDADAWFAYFAPARTPPDRIALLAKTIEAALGADLVRETFDRNAVVARFRPTAEMPDFVAAEVRKWAEVVRVSNAKPD